MDQNQVSDERDDEAGRQIISMRVGEERVALDILDIVEIVRLEDLRLTRVPHSHEYVLGVANLRGKVLPVLDLTARLRLTPVGAPTRVVVIEREGEHLGLAVQEVSSVSRARTQDFTESARVEGRLGTPVTIGQQIMTYLDVGDLLGETA